MLFLFCVSLWFLLRGVLCYAFPCSLFSYCSNPVSLGKEKAGQYVSRAFVCLSSCIRFLLISGVGRAYDCGLLWTLFFIQFDGIGKIVCWRSLKEPYSKPVGLRCTSRDTN